MKARSSVVASLPSDSGIAIAANDVAQNLERFHETRTGTIEILVAVSDEYSAIAHGAQRRPHRIRCEAMPVAFRLIDREAARQDDNDVRIGACEIVPCDPRRVHAG